MLLTLLSGCQIKRKKKQLTPILKLPTFKMLSLDSMHCINTNTLKTTCSFAFFYFLPDCEHCQQTTQSLLDHYHKIQNASIYMITQARSNDAIQFCKKFRLDTAKNIHVVQDYNHSFYKTFTPSTIPFLVIYDRNKTLKKIYHGEISTISIITTLYDQPNN